METLKTIDISILSLIILIFIYSNAHNHLEKVFMSYKLYFDLVKTNIVLIIVDILGWIFNRLPGSFNMILNKGSNFLLYLVVPVGPILWILYTDYQIFHDEKRIEKLESFLIIPFTINAAVDIISLFTGWYFTIDVNNIYHRGEYFWIHVILCCTLLIYSFFFIIINKDKIEKKYYYSLLLFFLPQGIATTVQVLFYGLLLNWTGMMLSLLIVYFNIQDHNLNMDYLTGVYNRQQLDNYMKYKIRSSSDGKLFSAILIDLDNFKKINDKFGHSVGDQALKEAVQIIKNCVRRNDFVARFGGDEFLVIMDIDNHKMLEEAVVRIKAAVEKFNKENHNSYNIGFCMGYDVYDKNLKTNADDFFNHIDILMYNNKKLH